MSQEYRNKITYLSFILAVLIVYRHSVAIDTYALTGVLYWIEQFIFESTDLVVPMFFALSGFLFYQNFDYSKLKTKLKSRFHSLLIPFVIWNLFGVLFAFTVSRIPFVAAHTNTGFPDYSSLWTFIYDVFIATKYNVTWFILNLMVYTIVTPLLKPLISNRLTGGGHCANCFRVRPLSS